MSSQQASLDMQALQKKYDDLVKVTNGLVNRVDYQQHRLEKAEHRADCAERCSQQVLGTFTQMFHRLEESDARAKRTDAQLEALMAREAQLTRQFLESEEKANEYKARLDALTLNDASGHEDGMGGFPRLQGQVEALSRRLDRAADLGRDNRIAHRGVLGTQGQLVKRVRVLEEKRQGLDKGAQAATAERADANAEVELKAEVNALTETVDCLVESQWQTRSTQETQTRLVEDLTGKVDLLMGYVDGLVEDHVEEVPSTLADLRKQMEEHLRL